MNKRDALISLSAAALVTIAGFEGYRGSAYDDGVGVQTIGFGTTLDVESRDQTDPVRALGMLYRDANEITKQISRCFRQPGIQHWCYCFL